MGQGFRSSCIACLWLRVSPEVPGKMLAGTASPEVLTGLEGAVGKLTLAIGTKL